MTDEDAFHAALDANPADSTLRLIFADWLEERDDPRAAGYRAMGERGSRPQFYVEESFPWSWWWATRDRDCHDLTEDWFIEVREMDPENTSQFVKDFLSRRAAEDAAALAFSRLSPEQQAAILQTAGVRT